MKHNLPENIRNFRKQKSLTQEQLAEAVGVTVGTVSKWENGNCLPDISMITELADFYEVSIDVLVGYDTPSKSVSNAIKKIEDYYKKHQLDEAILECNKALVKYPNNFDLLEKAARVYYIAGFETKDEIAHSRAKILYENALTNKPDNVKTTKEIAIRHGLAMLEKDSEKKVDLLRDININAIYNAEIGEVFRNNGDYDKANEYFSEGLYMGIIETTNIIGHWYDSLIKAEEINTCLTLTEFCIDMMRKAYRNGECGIGAKVLAQFEIIHSVLLNYVSLEGEARDAIDAAYQYAKNFDRNPTYDLKTGASFWLGKDEDDVPIAFDESGSKGVESLSGILNDTKEEYKNNQQLALATDKSIAYFKRIIHQ